MSPEASPGGFRGAIGPRRSQEVEEPPGDPRRPQKYSSSSAPKRVSDNIVLAPPNPLKNTTHLHR